MIFQTKAMVMATGSRIKKSTIHWPPRLVEAPQFASNAVGCEDAVLRGGLSENLS